MKTIILIPYRDREEHLDYFLKETVPKLKDIIKNLEILIIEQCDDGKRFNRGKILNVGFDYYNEDEYYYITQDIDMNPIKFSINYYYLNINDNEVLSIYSSHKASLGGIIKMNGKTFRRTNGFRNDIWGWGIEDRDFYHRCTNKKIKIKRILKKNLKFKIMEHERPYNIHSKLNIGLRKEVNNIFKSGDESRKDKYIMSSGLNNLNYKILKEEIISEYIKKIVVEI